MGLAARLALEAGTRDKDPEVRRRCAELLPEVLGGQLRAQVKGLLDDKDGKPDHPLPGWKLFREISGHDEAARRSFASLCYSQGVLLEQLEKDPKKAIDACAEQMKRIQQNWQLGSQMGPDEVLPLLLSTCHPKVKAPQMTTYALCNIFYQQKMRQALTGAG